jgi:hypothetical protein
MFIEKEMFNPVYLVLDRISGQSISEGRVDDIDNIITLYVQCLIKKTPGDDGIPAEVWRFIFLMIAI